MKRLQVVGYKGDRSKLQQVGIRNGSGSECSVITLSVEVTNGFGSDASREDLGWRGGLMDIFVLQMGLKCIQDLLLHSGRKYHMLLQCEFFILPNLRTTSLSNVQLPKPVP